jgi:hypothetical protein
MRPASRSMDAELRIRFPSCDLIEVAEAQLNGPKLVRTVANDTDVVADLEQRYIFFANEAKHARYMIAQRLNCVFYVLLREP